MSRSFQRCLGWKSCDQRELESPEIGLSLISNLCCRGNHGSPREFLSAILLNHGLLFVPGYNNSDNNNNNIITVTLVYFSTRFNAKVEG